MTRSVTTERPKYKLLDPSPHLLCFLIFKDLHLLEAERKTFTSPAESAPDSSMWIFVIREVGFICVRRLRRSSSKAEDPSPSVGALLPLILLRQTRQVFFSKYNCRGFQKVTLQV